MISNCSLHEFKDIYRKKIKELKGHLMDYPAGPSICNRDIWDETVLTGLLMKIES